MRLGLGCGDLLSAPVATEYVGVSVVPVDVDAGPGFSRGMALQQLGGVRCVWNDGNADVSASSSHSVELTVLPDAELKWQRYAEAYQITGDSFSYCYARDEFICGHFSLVNSTWIESYVQGIRPASIGEDDDSALVQHIAPLFDGISAIVAAATLSSMEWRSSALPLPTSCEAFIAPADIASLAGVDGSLDSFTYRDGPQVDQTLSMDGVYLSKACSWLYPLSDFGIGGMVATPGGAWAWDPIAEANGATPITIAGLPEDQPGYYECGEYRCSLNFAFRGNWINLHLDEGNAAYSTPYDPDQPDVLRAIAEKIIANLS
jgi:hypothetical protein